MSLKKCYAPAKAKKKVKEKQNRGLFLSGLFPSVKEEDIHAALTRFGEVESVRVMISKETKTCKGYGFAIMATKLGQKIAAEEKRVEICRKLIKITKLDKSKKNHSKNNGKMEVSSKKTDEKFGSGDNIQSEMDSPYKRNTVYQAPLE